MVRLTDFLSLSGIQETCPVGQMFQAVVKNVSWTKDKTPFKKIHLLPNNNETSQILTISIPRSVSVTNGDIIISEYPFSKDSFNGVHPLFIKCHNGITQIFPYFLFLTTVKIGVLEIPVTIKEITEQDEFEGYFTLSTYHYRDKTLFGRHAPLIAKMHHPLLPNVIGYIELTTAFFVNTPRRNILNQPTHVNGIAWEAWTKDVIRERIPLFVRIARCVVHPELRSTGLGKILVASASKFVQNHWQSANWKPYFMEISADMLRFIPFAEKAGMKYAGETEGNLKRIVRDLRYLNANENRMQKEIFKGRMSGILDTKFSQLQKAIVAKNGAEVKCPSDYVAQQIENPTLDGWAKLSGVLSFPKPHYMMGLTEEAASLISTRVSTLNLTPPTLDTNTYQNQMIANKISDPIIIKNASYEVTASINRTETTHEVERAFEISLDNIRQKIISNLNIQINPGEILVVTGLSGTGKTTLLNLISGKNDLTQGEIKMPSDAKIGALRPITVSTPLIEVLGKKDIGKGIYWMGVVGLSEPNLFVKPFHSLSAGQKYRAMIAKLLTRETNLWLIDEFCENLDVINTNLLSHKIATLARKVGATVIIASSDASRFIKSLKPDRVLILKGATDIDSFEILTNEEFIAKTL